MGLRTLLIYTYGSFSSALSSEGGVTSPGSSCPTPTSAGGGDDLVFTLGVTDGTPYQCLYCEKAFQRQNYLKKHQQVSVLWCFVVCGVVV
ncbi:hypothetical protein WDU94_000389 [Cyamophila willieti]